MRARSLLAVLALSAALGGTAAAEGPPPGERADPAAATALFQEGREAAKRGDYAIACLKMDESFRLDPAVGTLINLADCHERLGHLASAWQRYQEAVDKLPPSDDRLGALNKRIKALAPRVPRLTVTIAPTAPPDTRVTRDSIALAAASMGTALPLDPGAHVIVASAPGREDRRYPVDASEGRTDQVTVEPGAPTGNAPSTMGAPLGAAPSSAPKPPSTTAPVATSAPPSAGATLRVAGFAVGGLGLAMLVAAVGTGLALPSKQATVSKNCGAAVDLSPDQCNSVGFDAAQSGKTLATANTATWILGGIATAVGATLVVLGTVGKDKPGASVQVGASAGRAGAVLEGRFR
jgi:hypothetical protein